MVAATLPMRAFARRRPRARLAAAALAAACAACAPRAALAQTTLQTGVGLSQPLSGTYTAPAGGCAANISLSGATGGNAVLGIGGAGASFVVSLRLEAGATLTAAPGGGGTGCAVTYCSSGGGAATALFSGVPSAPGALLLAIAGAGAGSSTTVAQ